MKFLYTPACLIAFSLSCGSALAAIQTPSPDHPATVDGVQTVCTGSSEGARENPRWRAYPTRIEFAGRHGQYLGDETVAVSGEGKMISVHCAGPWVLMKLPKGSYKLSANISGVGKKELTISAPGHVVVRFPDAGGKLARSS